MYKKIMVPVDGSELAECVLPHIEKLAGDYETERTVVFMRVEEPAEPPRGEGFIVNENEWERMEASRVAGAEEYLKKLSERVRYKGIKAETVFRKGRVADTIAAYAEKNGFDLIVIATHGRSGVSRWVWGSVADRILRASCVPVLMVRAPGCVAGI
jgi:nucleotide-binding universal stress UspA family protein